MKKFTILLVLLLVTLSSLYSQNSKTLTTVYIVRHGEKDTSDPKNTDPELNMDGHERAKSLAAKLKKEKFAAVFSTKYKRTTQTGSLVAKNGNLAIEYYNLADPKGLAEAIKKKYKGKKVLIVGHSNTVLELAEAFGVSRPLPALTDDDYDFLFRVNINQDGYASLTTQNYGKQHHISVIKK